jgi:molecular chaperone DnaK (HSP70)
MAAATPFGIDLGTTQSCIARIDEDGRPTVVRNRIGEETVPSVVYFEGPGRAVVGTSAKNSAVLAPHLVAQLVKREMGDPAVVHRFHNRDYRPAEISALILRELAQSARETTKLDVEQVVITVPAHFGVAERDATRNAGEIAGLDVLDVVAEPIAAAMYYKEIDNAVGARHLLVCDLGGGTYDTTVITTDGGDLRVVCTGGDGDLGGADWDERIRDELLREFRTQQPALDPTADEEFMQELAIRAEEVKKQLSGKLTHRCDLRFRGAVARIEFTRQRMEELAADLLDRVVAVTEQTLATARERGVTDLDDVLLVGGMTKVSSVSAALSERLGLRTRHHEPELAVAKGAALFARMRAAERKPSDLAATGISRTVSVVPRALGVKVTDITDPVFATNPFAARQYVFHLLRSNTPLPADTGPFPFGSGLDNQRAVDIEVWEQVGPVESEELDRNALVGRGRLRDLPPGVKGSNPFEITFRLAEDGRLTVHAIEPGSGARTEFELLIGGMDKAAVAQARSDIARLEVTG